MKFSTYSLTLLFIFLIFGGLYKTQIGRKSRVFFSLATIVLGVMAFLFDPVTAWEKNGNYTDLYRFYLDMDAFQKYGWNGYERYFHTAYSNIPVIKALVFSVAKIGIYGLLAATSAAIVYGFTAKTLTEERRYIQTDTRSIVLAFMVFVILTNYKVMITNIRMPIGMALFFILSYYDLVAEKKNIFVLLGYISLLAIHPIFLVFLLLRLLTLFSGKYSMKLIVGMSVLSGGFLSVFSGLLELFGGGTYISSILYKIDFYTKGDKATYFETPIVVLGVIKIAMMLFLLWYYREKAEKSVDLQKVYNFSVIFVAFSIGSIWNYYLFMRMTNYLCFLVAFWGVIFFDFEKGKIRKTKKMTLSYNEFFIAVATMAHFAYYFVSYQYRVLCF